MNDLKFHVKKLGRGEQLKSKLTRNKKIKKDKAAINEIVNKKTIEDLMKTKDYP